MYLTHLSLTHFRNYARLEVDLQARLHVLRGDNAQGKTNLLESIYFLATTRSPLSTYDRELIGWSAEAEPIPHAHAEATFVRRGDEHRVEIVLVNEPPGQPGEPPTFRRRIRVDGVPRRAIDAVGQLNVSLFLPEDINLVAGPPAGRRRYLDVTLCQVDPLYCRTLSRYNRVVTQRNALLRQAREGHTNRLEMESWDAELARLGAYVLDRRRRAVEELEWAAAEAHAALTGGRERLALDYRSTVAESAEGDSAAELPEGREAVSQQFALALRRVRGEEAARGVTVVGPHRDDLRFPINGHDATTYGSRGQQRTVALSLKLAEVAFMEAATGETPVLLLDDVMSELDRKRSHRVLEMASRAQQVFLTTTELEHLEPAFLASAVVWEVEEGTLRPLDPHTGP